MTRPYYHLETILARIDRSANHGHDSTKRGSHRQVVVFDRVEWLIEQGLKSCQSVGPLDGDHGRLFRSIVEISLGTGSVFFKLGKHCGAVGGIANEVITI